MTLWNYIYIQAATTVTYIISKRKLPALRDTTRPLTTNRKQPV
jgi:hypothetical protein